MTDVNKAVEPSAPATPVQFDSWDEKGTPIVASTEPPKTQDSAPASASEKETPPAPKGETAAESGAAPKQEKKGEKLTAEERVQQAVREKNEAREDADKRVKALEERLRKLESAPQPASKTEPAKPVEIPKRPNPFKWTGTPEEFEAAMDQYENHLRNQTALEVQRAQQWQQVEAKNLEMLKEATAKYPDAETKIKEATGEIMKSAPDFIKVFVNDSDVLGDLLYALSDSTTLNNVLELAKTNPSKVLRVLRDMETDIQKAVSKDGKADAHSKTAMPDKKAPAPPEPRAPKPPSEVGGRGTASEDALVTAARSGDYRSFEAEETRRMQARFAK